MMRVFLLCTIAFGVLAANGADGPSTGDEIGVGADGRLREGARGEDDDDLMDDTADCGGDFPADVEDAAEIVAGMGGDGDDAMDCMASAREARRRDAEARLATAAKTLSRGDEMSLREVAWVIKRRWNNLENWIDPAGTDYEAAFIYLDLEVPTEEEQDRETLTVPTLGDGRSRRAAGAAAAVPTTKTGGRKRNPHGMAVGPINESRARRLRAKFDVHGKDTAELAGGWKAVPREPSMRSSKRPAAEWFHEVRGGESQCDQPVRASLRCLCVRWGGGAHMGMLGPRQALSRQARVRARLP